MAGSIALLALLIGLERVLGVDNILVITIFVGRLPESKRNMARIIGLAGALIARIGALALLIALSGLTKPVVAKFSIRDLLLLGGGLFLLYKAVKEIHETDRRVHSQATHPKDTRRVCWLENLETIFRILAQIV